MSGVVYLLLCFMWLHAFKIYFSFGAVKVFIYLFTLALKCYSTQRTFPLRQSLKTCSQVSNQLMVTNSTCGNKLEQMRTN